MIITYKDGIINQLPYDPKSINEFLKNIGVKAKKTREKGVLIIETDKDLTPEQIELLKTELDKYDMKRTKKLERVSNGKD